MIFCFETEVVESDPHPTFQIDMKTLDYDQLVMVFL